MNSMMGMTGYRGPTGAMAGRMNPPGEQLAGYDIERTRQFTPEQQQLFSSLFSHVSPDSYLSRLAKGDEGLFAEQERPALRQFAELQGNIASRFSGAGMGARRSSAFQNSLNSAASQLTQDLASRRQGLQRQAIMDLMGISESLLGQRPEEQYMTDPQKSFLQKVMGVGLPVAGTAFGFTPWGAATGGPAVWGSIGTAASKAF